jgi:subtilisin family serine protease
MNYQKLSASMAALVEEFRFPGTAMLSEEPRAVSLASFDATGSPEVYAFIRCHPETVIEQGLGLNMHTGRGTVRTGLISFDGLEVLSEREDVYRISPAVIMKPLNDLASLKTRLPLYRQNHGGSGKNVIVGVVDTGIDATHPAFAGRIHSIWDQTISGVGWDTTRYGTVLTGAALTVSSDTNGHGTHVAGTAAGSDVNFGGVAPDADIVVVKTNFQNTGIADGIRYIFAVADQLNRPAVVNLSLGGHHDAHDGSDDLSELISQRSGEGRIIVAAAGNEGGDDIHGAVRINPGQQTAIPFKVSPASEAGATRWIRLNGWYQTNASCEISVETSSGESTTFQPVISAGPTSRTYNLNSAVLRISTPTSMATPNGDHQFLVEITPAAFASFVQGGTWRLVVRNTGGSDVRIDVWSIVPQGAIDAAFLPPANSPDMKIGSPGASEQAITVGSFTSRNSWRDSSGNPRTVGLSLDDMSEFSSPGPLRTGDPKPDVAAPGAMIISCLSKHSSTTAANMINSDFRVNAGTSMACPYITGLVALLLQGAPSLDAAAIKAQLKTNSKIPGAAASGHFDPKWGFGLIDAGGL